MPILLIVTEFIGCRNTHKLALVSAPNSDTVWDLVSIGQQVVDRRCGIREAAGEPAGAGQNEFPYDPHSTPASDSGSGQLPEPSPLKNWKNNQRSDDYHAWASTLCQSRSLMVQLFFLVLRPPGLSFLCNSPATPLQLPEAIFVP